MIVSDFRAKMLQKVLATTQRRVFQIGGMSPEGVYLVDAGFRQILKALRTRY